MNSRYLILDEIVERESKKIKPYKLFQKKDIKKMMKNVAIEYNEKMERMNHV
jgi:hypothetical protein